MGSRPGPAVGARVVRPVPRLEGLVGRPAVTFGREKTKAIQAVIGTDCRRGRGGPEPRSRARASGSRGWMGRLPAGKAAS